MNDAERAAAMRREDLESLAFWLGLLPALLAGSAVRAAGWGLGRSASIAVFVLVCAAGGVWSRALRRWLLARWASPPS